MKNITITDHFKQRVDEYLGHYNELDNLTYTEIANPVLASTKKVTLLSGDKYIEVTLRGVRYGIGYRVKDNAVIVTTLISPLDAEKVDSRSFKCKQEIVKPLEA